MFQGILSSGPTADSTSGAESQDSVCGQRRLHKIHSAKGKPLQTAPAPRPPPSPKCKVKLGISRNLERRQEVLQTTASPARSQRQISHHQQQWLAWSFAAWQASWKGRQALWSVKRATVTPAETASTTPACSLKSWGCTADRKGSHACCLQCTGAGRCQAGCAVCSAAAVA